MDLGPERSDDLHFSPRGFETTHWSVVLSATEAGPGQDLALERLCRVYWYPVYSFIRRRGNDADNAQDLTQSFFERFLEKNYIARVDAAKGRFRTFLLCCVQGFLANEWDKQSAQKRGGGVRILSLDEQSADERFQRELAVEMTPERAFERQWVEAILESVLQRLENEFKAAGREAQFGLLKTYLVEAKGTVSFLEMARRLSTTEPAIKGIVRRMRQRYRDIFREEVAQTTADPGQVEEEIQYLLGVLTG